VNSRSGRKDFVGRSTARQASPHFIKAKPKAKMRLLFRIAPIILCFGTISVHGQWVKQNVNTTASFRGLSVVNEKVVWASGTGGTVIRTIDGGANWDVIIVPGSEKLDFRDIEAFDANTAYILSIGNGESSRIYKTTDGGKNWNLQFQNKNEQAFFDAVACWDRNNCIAMSDPVDNHFVLIQTKNGSTWEPIDTSKMPATKDGEAAFAASGTCLITQGKNNAFIVSGGMAARVFRSTDRGLTWTVADTPMVHGTSGGGIFSIAMFDGKNGVIVGGNYEQPNDRTSTFALTDDGGEHWQLGPRVTGYRSGVVFVDRKTIVAVGTSGSDVSYDRRLLWNGIGSENLNAIGEKGKNAVWSVGPKGGVYRMNGESILTKRETFDPRTTDYPHLANVTFLNLSHAEVSSKCESNNTVCSDNPKITVQTTALEFDSPHEYLYAITAGRIIGDGPNVEWDLSGVKPGKYSITAGLSIPAFLSDPNTFWEVAGATKTQVVVVH
jgi:photosystem II stability/assembly factor-like uncharacterized protein